MFVCIDYREERREERIIRKKGDGQMVIDYYELKVLGLLIACC